MADNSCKKQTLKKKFPLLVRDPEWFKIKGLLMGIDYVRVNKIDFDGDGIENKIDVCGTVVVSSRPEEHYIVYHRPSTNPDSKGLGEYLSLPDLSKDIIAVDVHITVNLRATLWKDGNEITREIAKGYTSWDSSMRMGTGTDIPLEDVVLGRHGSVSVGYSIMRRGLSATINIQMMNESPAQIYGTIKAHRVSRGSSTLAMRMLFDKSANESIQVNPNQSIPLTRPFFPVPFYPDSSLTIEVDLWNHEDNLMSPDYQIAMGSAQFTPEFGKQMKTMTSKNYGQVQVHITCE